MDVIGMVLLGISLLAAMFSASYLGEGNARAWPPALVVLLTISVVTMWTFFRHINHSMHPFIDPRLIYGPGIRSG